MKNLTDAIVKLAAALKASGKLETANFFDGLRNRLETASTVEESKSIANELTTMGKIVDYGNFSLIETTLFKECFEEAMAFISK